MPKINRPPFDKYPLVSNERITLRQPVESDLNDLMEISFYNAVQATTLEQAVEMNQKINQDYNNGNSIHWTIVEKQSGKLVGTCGYYRGFKNGQGELGCILLPHYRGMGFMTAAMQLAIQFGKSNMNLKRIWAVTDLQNKKAIQLLQRLDFKKIKTRDDTHVEFELNQV
ncbi:MAG TPA: GNAT family N-acetyltransferase [Flavobacteriaceae bacterium]|nr:GNAT family N-acetyltransferase [Flavobacteriaceae bacterium]